MSRFEAGQSIAIPCELQKGPFTDEYLVTIDTEKGPLSGFVRGADVLERHGGTFIRGLIVASEGDRVDVRIYGSFFTIAAGTTSVSTGWARTHLQEVSGAT